MKLWSRLVVLAAVLGSALFANKSSASPACLCTLQWQASPDPNVAGYALYYALAGKPMTNRVDVGTATTVTMRNLTASWTYNFYVVAYDADKNESAPSNLLPYTAPTISSLGFCQPGDGTMHLTFHVAPKVSCHVEYTQTLNPAVWKVLKTAVADTNGLVTIIDPGATNVTRYYRASVP